MWVDNNAGVQILKCGPEKDRFVLRSDEPVSGFEYKLTWQKGENGKVLNLHQRREVNSDEDTKWETLYEWVYIKNLNQNILPDDDEVE
jgi:hypothetical protein